MEEGSFDQTLDHVKTVLQASAVAGAEGTFGIRFLDDQPGLSFRLASGGVEVVDVPPASCDVCVGVHIGDYRACREGTASLLVLASERRIEVDGDLQLAIRFVQAFETLRAAAVGASPAARRDAAAPRQYGVPPRESERIARTQPRLATIEVLDRLDVETFRSKYLASGIPVVIRNAVERWPMRTWTPRDLLREAGKCVGMVRTGDYVSSGVSHQHDVRVEELKEFLERIDAGGSGSLPPYMGNNPLPRELALKCDFPDYFRREEYDTDTPRMWLGPSGTVTPLHRDPIDNLFVQLWGRKHFFLYSPDQVELLYTWRSAVDRLDGCDVDPETPDFTRFPKSREASALTLTVGSGEMLFIPEGWFHHVRALEASFSVNFWTVTHR